MKENSVVQFRRPEEVRDAVVRYLRETTYKASQDSDIGRLRWVDGLLRDKALADINRELLEKVIAAKLNSVTANSPRNSGFFREIACAAGPVCHTLSNQIQSKPCLARRARSASDMSPSVADRPRDPDSSVSHTRVLI